MDHFAKMDHDNRRSIEVIMSMRNYSEMDLLKKPIWEFNDILQDVYKEVEARKKELEGKK